jgi:hypothetical protein
MPFRLVAVSDTAPYPLDESQQTVEPPHMVDLMSGEQFHRADSIRQPIAEDFLEPHRLLPALPIEEYMHDSDQNLPIIEPDSDSNAIHTGNHYMSRPERVVKVNIGRRDTIATTQPLSAVKAGPSHKRSKSAVNLPNHSSQNSEIPEGQKTPVPVAAMGADMFSPVLGGLHRLPSAPARRPSKMKRLRWFFSFKRRQHGRMSQ